MALFGKNRGGLLGDLIQSPEQNREWLIYKWRPEGEEAGNTKRENTIRVGSPLRVRQGETAVFQYQAQRQALTGRSGQGMTMGGGQEDLIVGPFDGKLETANLPVLAGIQGLLMGGGTSFPASVYYINTAGVNQVKWAVPYFNMFDPRPQLQDHPVPVAVRGNITFRITDCQNFISLHALVDFEMDKFEKKIRDSIIDKVQNAMMDVQTFNKMSGGQPLIQINSYRRNIAAVLQQELVASLSMTYGVALTELNIAAIEIDQESESYGRLAKLTRDIAEAQVGTQAELAQRGMQDQYNLNLSNMQGQQAINLEHMQDSLLRQREETQAAQNMQTQLGGFAMHQLRQQEEIAKAQAAAMGQFGQGMGQASMGGGSGGFNPAGMMAMMPIAGAMGQSMANMMQNQMGPMMGQPMGQGMAQPPGGTPPPIPVAAPAGPPPVPGAAPPAPPPAPGAAPALQFNVSVEGQTYGPFDMNALAQMASGGQINAQSMVWRQGMAEWQQAGSVPELVQLFGSAPPPPPVQV